MFRTVRWRIALPYALLTLTVMGALALYLAYFVRQSHLDNLRAQLTTSARIVAADALPLLAGTAPLHQTDALAKQWAEQLQARVTLIAPDGTVFGESDSDRTDMDNHLLRPEIQQALEEGVGSAIRFSRTVDYDMLYVAVTITNGDDNADDELYGLARVALPLTQIDATVSQLRRTLLAVMLGATILAILLAVVLAERTARPVRRLTQAAERLAAGDLEARLLSAGPDEVGDLTRAFNNMAGQLRQQVSSLASEQSRLSAVLDHMADGVLIADSNGRVRLLNPAATRLLDISHEMALGRSIAEVVRHHQLIELWHRCRQQGSEQAEIVEVDRKGIFLQAIVSPFQEDEAPGYLMILQDLTQIRRLETVRRDFISNISHELRTPLAGLVALVDTLRDGALDDPPAAAHFLNRMDIELDALTQMVQELLELSRIESGQVPLRLATVTIPELVTPAVERLRPQAERANTTLHVEIPAGLPLVAADAQRIGQVVGNLVHNAIKFTPPGGRVTVRAYPAEQGEAAVVVEVADTGEGIAAEELPRIFERFYKADRARSSGGTGLGLAIARHLVQAHGGHIWAKSKEGKGSTFSFSLPQADN
jgi:two-component system phosphate regulon sensor histidine kinase PhoR